MSRRQLLRETTRERREARAQLATSVARGDAHQNWIAGIRLQRPRPSRQKGCERQSQRDGPERAPAPTLLPLPGSVLAILGALNRGSALSGAALACHEAP